MATEADQALADSFDAPSDDEGSGDEKDGDDRRRLIQDRPSPTAQPDGPEGYGPHGFRTRRPPVIERRVTQFPSFTPEAPAAAPGRVYGGGSHANDGVFANLSAKPEKGEKAEEHPPVSSLGEIYLIVANYLSRAMNRLLRMLLHHIGRRQSSLLAWALTTFLSMDYLLDPSFHSRGTE